MIASATNFVTGDEDTLARNENGVRRSPLYLTGQGEPLFAWLHQHSEIASVDHGVIICAPIGYEQLHSHRSLRHLADSLAAESIPTLRFDWHGTGDSPGVDEDPFRFRVWKNNIGQAVQWMRNRLGCRKVSLIGLRMGATLATLATEENEIDNLVLWSPIPKGRAYVREMKAISLTAETPVRATSTPSDDIEAAGFTLTSQTASELSLIDLFKFRPQSGNVLVVARADLPNDDRLSTYWATQGVHVQQIAARGYAEMMTEPHHGEVPYVAIHQITEWLTRAIKVTSSRLAEKIDETHVTSISIPSPKTISNSENPQLRFRESTFQIHQQPDLFGIVSEPQYAVDPERPVVVLLNAGSTHRIGPNRLYVLLARRLADQGFRCVRMDLSGLGDSVCESVEDENETYPATAFRDVDLTLKQIEKHFGAKRIVLMGLCSGAYAAFQSAAMIRNPVLVESVLINPLTYFWREGMTLSDSPTKHLRSFHYYKGVALDPKKWLRLLTGQSKIGIRGAVTLLALRLKILKAPTAFRKSSDIDMKCLTGFSHPEKEDLPDDLKRITDAGRKLAMIFSTTDPGFGILNFHAKRKVSQLRATGQLRIEFIDDSDHTFTTRSSRVTLIDVVADHLAKQYP